MILGPKTVFPDPHGCSEGPTGENEDLGQVKTPAGYGFDDTSGLMGLPF